MPTVVYNDLAEFTYGAAYTASQSFPVSLKERVAVGNLEYYAMDTYKPYAESDLHLWHARNLEYQCHQPARPVLPPCRFVPRCIACNQSAAESGRSRQVSTICFPQRRCSSSSRASRLRTSFCPRTAVHAGFGVFNDIIPAQIADTGRHEAPNDPTFIGGIGGQVGGMAIAPGVPGSAVDAAVSANKSFQTIFSSGGAPCAGIQPGAPTCPLAVSLNTFPTRDAQDAVLLPVQPRHRAADRHARQLRVGLCRHARTARALSGAAQRLSERLRWMLRAFPYQQPLDQRFGSVNEFRTDANSSYARTADCLHPADGGLTLRGNYTFSHCLDEVSNGGLLAFSTQGFDRRCPAS